MSEDLYEVLGVSKNASSSEIKSAYRKIARKYHPDVNKEPGSEDTFKKIQKAYSVLSDTEKKRRYDQFGVADDSASGPGGGGFGGFEGFSSQFGGDFSDVFDTFFGGSSRGQSRGSIAGEDLRFDLSITLEEAATGIEKEIQIYRMENDPKTTKVCSKCNGTGQVKIIQRTMLGSIQQVTTCPQCHGQGCTNKQKKKKKLKISIPAGVETGNKLRVTGEGSDGPPGGNSGDLYVFIEVKKHAFFQREDTHIYIKIELPFTQLILGRTIEVPTLNGRANLKVPAGSQPGTTFKLRGKGLPNLQGYGHGNQYVHLSARFPKQLSEKERSLIEEIQNIRDDNKVTERIEDYIIKH